MLPHFSPAQRLRLEIPFLYNLHITNLAILSNNERDISGKRFVNLLSFTPVGTNANGRKFGGFADMSWQTS